MVTLAIDGPHRRDLGRAQPSRPDHRSADRPAHPQRRHHRRIVVGLRTAAAARITAHGYRARVTPSCRLTQDGASRIYRALIDTRRQAFPLYPPPSGPPPFDIATLFRSIVIPPESFGAPFTPAPSLIGPQADTELRLEHKFDLLNECVLALASVYVVPQQGVTPTPSKTPTATPRRARRRSNTPTSNTPTATTPRRPTSNTPTPTTHADQPSQHADAVATHRRRPTRATATSTPRARDTPTAQRHAERVDHADVTPARATADQHLDPTNTATTHPLRRRAPTR